MDQNMVTLVTNMQFSKERLEEIFAVPKTKQLYEQFIKQERNEAQIKELSQMLGKIVEGEDVESASNNIYTRLKVYILAASLECVINGKSLNEAIHAEIKEQLKEETAIKKVKADILELERVCAMFEFMSGWI